MKDIDELDALHAAATAGEWRVEHDRVVHAEHGEWVALLPHQCLISLEVMANANAASIAALHNAWPSVSARLRAVAEAEVERLRGEVAAATTPRPLDEWHEDDGVVLWWRFPISEPPYVGTPLDDDWPVMGTAEGGTTHYATHWTRLLEPARAPDDPFACCGGNDEKPPHHCSDCPDHPWAGEPDPRCMAAPHECPHAEEPR